VGICLAGCVQRVREKMAHDGNDEREYTSDGSSHPMFFKEDYLGRYLKETQRQEARKKNQRK